MKKISITDFVNYMSDALQRWRVRYEKDMGSEECPERQHFGAWLRALIKFISADRSKMAERGHE